MIKLVDRFICDAFRQYCREQPCANCHAEHSTPAHEISRKRGDGSDALCINLCMVCHKIFDDWGKVKINLLRELWGIEIEELHFRLWGGFMREQGIYIVIVSQEQFEARCAAFGLRDGSDSKRKTRGGLTKTVNKFQ